MVGDIVAAHQQGDGQHRGQDRLAHEPLTFAFCLCLEVSHVRHVAADRALDVLGLDAGERRPDFCQLYARARVMGSYPEIVAKPQYLRDRNALQRRRCASAIRARPAFVLGPVDIPP